MGKVELIIKIAAWVFAIACGVVTLLCMALIGGLFLSFAFGGAFA